MTSVSTWMSHPKPWMLSFNLLHDNFLPLSIPASHPHLWPDSEPCHHLKLIYFYYSDIINSDQPIISVLQIFILLWENTHKIYHLTILSEQLSGIKDIHIIVQQNQLAFNLTAKDPGFYLFSYSWKCRTAFSSSLGLPCVGKSWEGLHCGSHCEMPSPAQ